MNNQPSWAKVALCAFVCCIPYSCLLSPYLRAVSSVMNTDVNVDAPLSPESRRDALLADLPAMGCRSIEMPASLSQHEACSNVCKVFVAEMKRCHEPDSRVVWLIKSLTSLMASPPMHLQLHHLTSPSLSLPADDSKSLPPATRSAAVSHPQACARTDNSIWEKAFVAPYVPSTVTDHRRGYIIGTASGAQAYSKMTSLIQSSGAGKTRALDHIAESVFTVPICLRNRRADGSCQGTRCIQRCADAASPLQDFLKEMLIFVDILSIPDVPFLLNS